MSATWTVDNADFVVTSAQLPHGARPDHEGADFTVDQVPLQFATLHFKPGRITADFTAQHVPDQPASHFMTQLPDDVTIAAMSAPNLTALLKQIVLERDVLITACSEEHICKSDLDPLASRLNQSIKSGKFQKDAFLYFYLGEV